MEGEREWGEEEEVGREKGRRGWRGEEIGGGATEGEHPHYRTKLDGSILICFSAILFQSFSMISITIACSCLEHSFPSQEYTVI